MAGAPRVSSGSSLKHSAARMPRTSAGGAVRTHVVNPTNRSRSSPPEEEEEERRKKEEEEEEEERGDKGGEKTIYPNSRSTAPGGPILL